MVTGSPIRHRIRIQGVVNSSTNWNFHFVPNCWTNEKPGNSSIICLSKKLKTSLHNFFEKKFFIDPLVSTNISFHFFWKASSAYQNAGEHLRNLAEIGYNSDAIGFRTHWTQRQFTFHGTSRKKSYSRICNIHEIAEHKWFEATCNLPSTVNQPLSQFWWSN